MVSKDIPAYAIAIGCPIKIIRYRFPPEIVDSLKESKWWDQNEEILKDVEKNFFEVEKLVHYRISTIDGILIRFCKNKK